MWEPSLPPTCSGQRLARFEIPDRAQSFIQRVESAAETYVVRELFRIPGVLYDGGTVVHYHGAAIRLQVPPSVCRLDLVVQFEQTRLAVEIDGLEHHGLTQSQFARDYQRARRLMIGGYVVVRFTASEAMAQPRQCWRDVFAILRVRTAIEPGVKPSSVVKRRCVSPTSR